MDIAEFAKLLDGREYGEEITKKEEALAKELGFVIVFGYSDDNMELRGAIDDEFGCYDGGTACINSEGLLETCSEECRYYQAAKDSAKYIEAVWNTNGYSWVYETNIQDIAKFDILEDGEKFCEGLVFDVKELQ